MRDRDDVLATMSADPPHAGIFMDFDGTLSAVVPRPEDAMPVAGAVGALEELASRYGLVAVVSGRSLDDLVSRVPARGVLLAGTYGRERADRPKAETSGRLSAVADAAAGSVATLAGVRVERKDAGVALHYRAAPHLQREVRAIADALAQRFHLEVKPGRMVAELVLPGPGKGEAILGLMTEHSLSHALVAGDDWGDLEAFTKLRESNVSAVIVAVSSAESPPALEEYADIVVSGPDELVDLLRELASKS